MASVEPEAAQPDTIPTHGPYSGWIDTTYDALLVYEAASRGVIPRITRRLTANERALIGSGTIFVYDERESGIKRWTDGYTWSPSRAQNNFFLYREVLNRSPNSPNKAPLLPPPKREYEGDGGIDEQCCYSEEVRETFEKDRNLEKALVGSLRNSYPFKIGGMMKKTISFCVKGVVSHHIVSYYTLEDVVNGRLIKVSDIPEIRELEISAVYMDNLEVLNFPPKTVKTEEGRVRYISEADDIDKSRAGRPKDHPHVRAEERARQNNFGADEDEDSDSKRRSSASSSSSTANYSRYSPYYRRRSSTTAYSPEDERMPVYYYPHQGPPPSRRPSASNTSQPHPGYAYPYDPYSAYHWYAQQAAYYAPYPSVPYGYPPYPSYPPYYQPDPRYGQPHQREPSTPGQSSVDDVEKTAEEVEGEHMEGKGKNAAPPVGKERNGADVEVPPPSNNGHLSATTNSYSRSMSPLTPVADEDDSS